MKLSPLVVVCALSLAACRNAPASGTGEGDSSSASSYAGPAPIVTGVVLDARTGKPIAGALVRGPGGVETKSDARGHFILRGLALGAAGELVGTSPAGLSGKNMLRALDGGPLEVVLHLR